jgi:ATP-binding protein involved in chromosome partitioning
LIDEMSQTLQQRIATALASVVNPRTAMDVVTGEMIRDVATTTSGKVRLTMLLTPDDPATLVRDVREALEGLAGVTEVRVDVKDASAKDGRAAPPPPPAAARTLPVVNDAPAAPQRPSAPTPVLYPGRGRIIAVSSGKGGVGKSTVATNLAVALAATGARVGLMDADVYGPNVPRMMGVNAPPPVVNEKIIPLQAHGVKIISLGFLIERDQPAIWRGPIVMKIVTQFLRDVAWGQLDYFLVDMPPGTGDAQLSLVQATQVHGAIIVTTPQDVATGDALRGAKMFQRVNVPVLGIVENMSWFECPHCGKPTPIFGTGGGKRLADELELPLLGQIPLYPRIHESGDRGTPIVVADPDSSASRALRELADRVTTALGATVSS